MLLFYPIRSLCFISCLLIKISFTSSVWACGVNSHIWITDTAICQLPLGSQLREFFTQQNHVDLTRLGSVFPDSGYAINHEYGEIAHWSPFIQAYIQQFRQRYPHPNDWDENARQEAAFLLGVMAHGVEDEWFDTQFLRWVEQEDTQGQDLVDPGLDYLLIYQGHTEIFPPLFFPHQMLLDSLATMSVQVAADQVEDAMNTIHGLALRLSQNPRALESLVTANQPLLPWTYEHYLNIDYDGSFTHLSHKMTKMLESTWLQLRGVWDSEALIIDWDGHKNHPLPAQLAEITDESRWISIYFATGVDTESLIPRVRLLDESGQSLAIETRASRWGGMGYTRIYEMALLQTPQYVASDASWHVQGLLPMWIEIDAGLTLVTGEQTMSTYKQIVYMSCPTDQCIQGQPLGDEEEMENQWGGKNRGCWVEEDMNLSDQGVPTFMDMSPQNIADFSVDAHTNHDHHDSIDQNMEQNTMYRDAGNIVNQNTDETSELTENSDAEMRTNRDQHHSQASGCQQVFDSHTFKDQAFSFTLFKLHSFEMHIASFPQELFFYLCCLLLTIKKVFRIKKETFSAKS